MAIKASTLAAIQAKGLNAESPEQDLKKAYFAAAGAPLSKAMLPQLIAALNGDQSQITTGEAPATAKASAKTAAPAKEKAAPKEKAAAETPEAALKRLKSDPATADRWKRVTEVLEMGNKGPIRVRIKTDDPGPNGEVQYRDIKVQDLFQVRFSAGYARKGAKKAGNGASTTTTDNTASTEGTKE